MRLSFNVLEYVNARVGDLFSVLDNFEPWYPFPMCFRFTITKPPVLQRLSFIAIFLVVCQFSYASTPIVHEISVDASAAIEEFRFWENQIKRALEDEELPIYWAQRATSYAFRGRDENAIDRARYLLRKVVEQPEPSAAAFYEIAKYCDSDSLKNWCDQNFVIEKLKETDPENVAVYFADFPRLGMYEKLENLEFLDNEENRERLRLASLATRVDEYYSRDAASWAQFARKAGTRIPPPKLAVEILIEYYEEGIPEQQLHGFHRPIEGVIWKQVHRGWGGSPLSGLPHLCKLMAHLSDKEAVKHCELVAELLLFESTEPMQSYIGYRINSALVSALNPESPELAHLEALGRVESDTEQRDRIRCERPVWSMNGVMPNGGLEDLNLYYQDLQDSSYFVANRKAIGRELVAAGLPASDCRGSDIESVTVIMRTYWPDYEPRPNNEFP